MTFLALSWGEGINMYNRSFQEYRVLLGVGKGDITYNPSSALDYIRKVTIIRKSHTYGSIPRHHNIGIKK